MKPLTAAVLLAVVLCPCLLHFTGSAGAATAARPCGSYYEAGKYGEYTGDHDRRVSVMSEHAACGGAIKIVREFRSYLGKRHHGPAGEAGSWTIPADPGWDCHRQGAGGSCDRGRAVADFRVTVLSKRASCGDLAFHNAGVIFLTWRHVGCGLRHRIGRSLLHGALRDVRGFRCHRLNLRAGGGGALCRRGGRFVEVGFE